MGKRNKRRLNLCFTIVLLILLQNICFSQTKIFGSVKNNTNKLYSVSVILKDSLSKSIISYTYTDENGNYELIINEYGKFNLVFTSLGYEKKLFKLKQINLRSKLTLKFY